MEEVFRTAIQDDVYAVREYKIRQGALYSPAFLSHHPYKYKDARCGNHLYTHAAPGRHCTCGYYCYSLDHVLNSATAVMSPMLSYGGVKTLVKLEGRTIIGTDGYRAQRLRIVALNCAQSDLMWDLWPRGSGRNTLQAYLNRRLNCTFIPDKKAFLAHLKEFDDPESIKSIRARAAELEDTAMSSFDGIESALTTEHLTEEGGGE